MFCRTYSFENMSEIIQETFSNKWSLISKNLKLFDVIFIVLFFKTVFNFQNFFHNYS